ncbi:sugar transferase [Weissella cibaria]
MIVIAGTIWLVTHENPIFKQTRFGRHSQPFEVYKFRTWLDRRRWFRIRIFIIGMRT